MSSVCMPSLFIGHGSPMNLVLENAFTHALQELSQKLPLPKAILVISAHWYTDATTISIASGIASKTLYDFHGFPKVLYDINYESPSNTTIAKRIATLLDAPMLERGLDHGAWMPLHFLFPKASVPVIELSINKNLPMPLHVKIGEQLQVLRKEGIMIVGSGNITHNLKRIDAYAIDAPVAPWAQNVDNFISNAFTCNDIESLVNIQTLCPEFETAHPSLEHYMPLLYIAGSRLPNEEAKILTPFFQNSSLSMKGFMFS